MILGPVKLSDREVARRTGRTFAVVNSQRLMLGIPALTPRWTKAEDSLLGTNTDEAIARILGRAESGVTVRRKRLQIPVYR
jgi:hypothetical protein